MAVGQLWPPEPSSFYSGWLHQATASLWLDHSLAAEGHQALRGHKLSSCSQPQPILRSCLGRKTAGISEACGKGWAWPISLALVPLELGSLPTVLGGTYLTGLPSST